MPERPRRRKAVDHNQHLFHLRPVPVQGHRIAARGPAVAETNHAADIRKPQRRIDDRQRKDHVLAGIHRAILAQDDFGGNAARHHRIGNGFAFRTVRSRRDAAADDRPAKIALAPEPDRSIDAFVDIDARAEHEQQIGRFQRRDDQMFGVDRSNLGLGRQSRASIGHGRLV